MYWTLPTIIVRIRKLIGLPQQFQVSDAELTARINDYYQSRFPIEFRPDELETNWRFETVGAYQIATGDGATQVFSGTLTTIPGLCGVGFSDALETFHLDSDGNLFGTYGGTGTVDYNTGDYALTFNTAPVDQSQIGVWYDSVVIPDSVLVVEDPITIAGFPIALFEDADYFWSRWPSYQPFYIGGAAPPIYLASVPQEVLVDDGRVTMRPVPDNPYLFEAASLRKPPALSGNSTPLKDIWGPLIIYTVAEEWVMDTGDTDRLQTIAAAKEKALSDATTPQIMQMMKTRAKGHW